MRRNVISVAMVSLVCGILLPLGSGCGEKQLSQPTPAQVTASTDQQIQKVQANPDLDETQKANIINMLKSHPAPPPATSSK